MANVVSAKRLIRENIVTTIESMTETLRNKVVRNSENLGATRASCGVNYSKLYELCIVFNSFIIIIIIIILAIKQHIVVHCDQNMRVMTAPSPKQ